MKVQPNHQQSNLLCSSCLNLCECKLKLLRWTLSLCVSSVSPSVSTQVKYVGDQFILLPCEFSTFDMENPTVVWSHSSLTPSTVHQLDLQGNELTNQNRLYRGRTSMKADALETGDLTLNLTNLLQSDSGTYSCTIRTSRGEEQRVAEVELLVKGKLQNLQLQFTDQT